MPSSAVFRSRGSRGFIEVSWRARGRWWTRRRSLLAYAGPTGRLPTKWYVESKWYSDSVPHSTRSSPSCSPQQQRAPTTVVITSSRVRNTAQDESLSGEAGGLRFAYATGTAATFYGSRSAHRRVQATLSRLAHRVWEPRPPKHSGLIPYSARRSNASLGGVMPAVQLPQPVAPHSEPKHC